MPSRPSGLRLYGMQERADHLDFDIRFEGARDVLARPHRHEYFQIQVSIEGGSEQLVVLAFEASAGVAPRPFRSRGGIKLSPPRQRTDQNDFTLLAFAR